MIYLIALFVIAAVLVGAMYFTYLERKILAFMQQRKGPNVVGPWGLLQPIADAVKSLFKEMVFPENASKFFFLFAPVMVFALSFMPFMVIPFDKDIVLLDTDYGLLYILLISLLIFICLMLAGVYSYSNYGRLSALRLIAQFISFEIPLVLVFLTLGLSASSLDLQKIVEAQQGCWYFIRHFPLFLTFVAVMMMECNRTPFDIPQAESEIVSGYQVEYSGLLFSYFMFFEYVSMLFMSFLCATLFFGGWSGFTHVIPGYVWLWGKAFIISVFFIWFRATFPRLRYDQMLDFSFKILVPVSFVWFLVVAGARVL